MDTENSQPKPSISSMLALFSSEHLTIEMAILYLHAHAQDSAILNILLPAFNRFST